MPKGRVIEDPELREYAERIGKKEYNRVYKNLWSYATYNKNTRYSLEKYENSPETLEKIKEKYKNGVPLKEIEQMVMGANKCS